MILSIDQGTTGTSALVFDKNARLLSKAYGELPQHFPRPGWVEHNPDEILSVTLSVIKKTLSSSKVKPSRISAIGITNQRETSILWNRKTGRPVAPAIVWQCRRTASICEKLKKRGLEGVFRKKTGLILDAYFSGTKIKWLLDSDKKIRKCALRGELAFGTVDSWLLWNLTGKKVHATDYTNASRTLLYNIKEKCWDKELLDMLGIPSAILPEVKPSSHFYGKTQNLSAIPSGIPIAGIAGDQQASLVGHGCLKAGMAKNTYGTGCFLLLNTGDRFISSKNGLISTLAVGMKENPVFALEGSVFIAGAAVQWLRDSLKIISSASDTEQIAKSTSSTGGAYVVPAFVGLGAPYWDMQARGAIVGLTRGSTKEMIVRATLESLAYQTRDVLCAMQKDSGFKLSSLQVDGGAASNDWLMQFQADILNIPVLRPALVANTAKGAALLAGLSIGYWRSADIVDMSRTCQKVFVPKMKPRLRESLYEGWLEAVSRVMSRRK
jgi:glycerol kinase